MGYSPSRNTALNFPSPQYSLLELPEAELRDCLALTSRAIVLASWLAAVARRELARFQEFISWIRYGNNVIYRECIAPNLIFRDNRC